MGDAFPLNRWRRGVFVLWGGQKIGGKVSFLMIFPALGYDVGYVFCRVQTLCFGSPKGESTVWDNLNYLLTILTVFINQPVLTSSALINSRM